jgi:hypothetical protein
MGHRKVSGGFARPYSAVRLSSRNRQRRMLKTAGVVTGRLKPQLGEIDNEASSSA